MYGYPAPDVENFKKAIKALGDLSSDLGFSHQEVYLATLKHTPGRIEELIKEALDKFEEN